MMWVFQKSHPKCAGTQLPTLVQKQSQHHPLRMPSLSHTGFSGEAAPSRKLNGPGQEGPRGSAEQAGRRGGLPWGGLGRCQEKCLSSLVGSSASVAAL